LIVSQLDKGVGIFACEAYAVLSSEVLKLEAGGRVVNTGNIGDMKCEYGGQWNLALNTDIFVRAWKWVFTDATYLTTDFTVKVDPDAVFLPSRLHHLLRHADGAESVYYNNCDQGLHGPIEVVSRGGTERFAEGVVECESKLKDEYNEWGEDVFIRHCLGFLGVSRVDNFQLLSEDHCFEEDPAHDGCHSGKVSFHPFKTVDSYFQCWHEAHTPNKTHAKA